MELKIKEKKPIAKYILKFVSRKQRDEFKAAVARSKYDNQRQVLLKFIDQFIERELYGTKRKPNTNNNREALSG